MGNKSNSDINTLNRKKIRIWLFFISFLFCFYLYSPAIYLFTSISVLRLSFFPAKMTRSRKSAVSFYIFINPFLKVYISWAMCRKVLLLQSHSALFCWWLIHGVALPAPPSWRRSGCQNCFWIMCFLPQTIFTGVSPTKKGNCQVYNQDIYQHHTVNHWKLWFLAF